MCVEVNGAEIGRDMLSNTGWPFEDLIASASRGNSVKTGDVLGSGTCGAAGEESGAQLCRGHGRRPWL
jgi:2-keto-4-pentenoate hydratase/2-oxohepta-3-ene-1,7-dioic acid hydratase in catechol pathway